MSQSRRIVRSSSVPWMICALLFALGIYGSIATAAPVALQQATATYQQSNFGNKDQTIDGNTAAGGMGFFDARQAVTNIVWETQADVTGSGLWTITLDSNLGAGHTLQHFRLSATDAPRSTFANNLPPNGSTGPAGDVLVSQGNWFVLSPVSATSSGGATLTVDANGRITASGTNPATDTYTITAQSPVGNITGLRLEALPGGNGFAGRSAFAPHGSNGNLVLTELSADFAAGGTLPATPTLQVNLQNATASFNQASYNIAEAIDGIAHGNDNGWAISGGQTSPQTAVFQTDGPVNTNRLVFEIDQTTTFAAHKMQEFRLSYTTDANPTEGDGSINWIEIAPTDASTSLATSDAAINLATNTVSITGSSAVPDIYQVIAEGDFLDVTGFQLEALLGANDNVGFGGNIVLSEFNVFAQQVVPEPASIAIWSLLGLTLFGYGYARMRRSRAST